MVYCTTKTVNIRYCWYWLVGLSHRHDGSLDHRWIHWWEISPILDAQTRLQMSQVKPRSGDSWRPVLRWTRLSWSDCIRRRSKTDTCSLNTVRAKMTCLTWCDIFKINVQDKDIDKTQTNCKKATKAIGSVAEHHNRNVRCKCYWIFHNTPATGILQRVQYVWACYVTD